MIETTIHLYPFNELQEKAQEKALQDHREFLLSTMHPSDFISGCPEYDTPEELQKQYESEYDYYLFNDDPIKESIEINDYYFFFDGTIANTTLYTAGPNVGKMLINIHGETDLFTMEAAQ